MATQDIIDLLTSDHDLFRSLFDELETCRPDERGDLFQKIVFELARHEAAEESIVHPTTRDEVAQGEAVAKTALEEESKAEKLMASMESMDSQSDEFLASFRELRDDVLQHATYEESEEFPRLRELDEQRLTAMADGFRKVKETAPTHPHPKTPQTPEVRAAVGPIAGIFDRARDAAREAVGS